MSFNVNKLKQAFTPKNLKDGMSAEEKAGNSPRRYLDNILSNFYDSNPTLVGQTLSQITKPINSGMKSRFKAIDKIIFSQTPDEQDNGMTLLVDILMGKKSSTSSLRGGMVTPPEEEEEKESENPGVFGVMNPTPNEPIEPADEPVVYQPAAMNPPPATDPFEGIPLEENLPLPSITATRSRSQEAEARLQATIDSIPTGEAEAAVADEPITADESAVTATEPAVSTEIKRSVTTAEQPSFGSTKDSIPKKRLISDGKSAVQLYNDIVYFKKNFPNETKNIEFDSRNRNPEYLLRKHKEFVAKLKPDGPEADKKVGVIITASEYIKDKLKEIILENSINGLTAKDLIIDIEGEADTSEDIQSYEFKTGPNGMPFARKEPIYKYIPESNPQIQLTKGKIPNTVTKYRGLEVTARQQVRQDPFVKPRKTIRLKYSY